MNNIKGIILYVSVIAMFVIVLFNMSAIIVIGPSPNREEIVEFPYIIALTSGLSFNQIIFTITLLIATALFIYFDNKKTTKD